MKSFSILCILLFITVVHCAPVNSNDPWLLFKQVHGKQYNSVEEESIRRNIWEANLIKIRQHNLEADLGIHSYYLGMNVFGDLTHEEFRQKFLGGIRMSENIEIPDETSFTTTEINALPPSIDWREHGYVTPIKNELQCGACWAFSATGSLEGLQAKKHQKLVSLSEQNLVDCSDSFGNFGCNGGWMTSAFSYVVATGLDTEESYPYKGVAEKCHFNARTIGVRATGYVNITAGSEAALQKAIAEIGPISVALDASHSSFQLYKSGVYDEPACSSTQLDFAGTMVGYGTQGKDDYYIFKNIWGTTWGDKGYMLMSRNKKNQCGVATLASYPIVA